MHNTRLPTRMPVPSGSGRWVGAILALLSCLLLAVSGCGSSSQIIASTPISHASADVTPGTQSAGGTAGYLVTCETAPAEDPQSCFLRPLNASDGSPRWTRHLTQTYGAICADDQTIYIMLTNRQTGTGVLAAYNASDGSLRWQASEAESIGPAAAGGDAVYGARLAAGQTVMSAIGATDGKSLWSTPVGPNTLRQVIVDGGRVYARLGMAGSDGPPDDHLVVLDVGSGKILWKAAITGEAGPIAVANGTLYVRVTPVLAGQNSPDAPVYSSIVAYRGSDGAVLWKHAVPLQGPPNLLAATSDAVYAAVGRDQYARGGVAALRASTGTLLWSTRLGAPGQFFAGLVTLNGVVYTATSPIEASPPPVGHLYALASSDGAVLSDHSFAEGGILNLQQSGGTLFVWTNSNAQQPIGAIEALRPADAAVQWKVPVDNRNATWFQAAQ